MNQQLEELHNDEPKLKVQFLGCSNNPVEVIYSAFRICYSQDNASEIWRKIREGEISKRKMESFLSKQLGTGHTSPLRQTHFVFVVDNISRAATAQFNRHHIGIERAEMSQRNVNFNRGIKAFITPDSFRKEEGVMERWRKLRDEVMEFYNYCLEKGIRQEDARFALPMATVSREQFSMGFQAMQNFLDVRLCERAQWEIKEMAWRIYKIMRKEFPSLSRRLGIKCWQNRYFHCDEDYKAYQGCRWSKSRPHKKDLSRLWKMSKHNAGDVLK